MVHLMSSDKREHVNNVMASSQVNPIGAQIDSGFQTMVTVQEKEERTLNSRYEKDVLFSQLSNIRKPPTPKQIKTKHTKTEHLYLLRGHDIVTFINCMGLVHIMLLAAAAAAAPTRREFRNFVCTRRTITCTSITRLTPPK